eukprot:30717-Eustigmatos_ZCMA.PRE.1
MSMVRMMEAYSRPRWCVTPCCTSVIERVLPAPASVRVHQVRVSSEGAFQPRHLLLPRASAYCVLSGLQPQKAEL